MTKATGGRRESGLHFTISVHHQRKSGQKLKQNKNLEAGADAEAMEECCLNGLLLVACSICFLARRAPLASPRRPLGPAGPPPPLDEFTYMRKEEQLNVMVRLGMAPPIMVWGLPYSLAYISSYGGIFFI